MTSIEIKAAIYDIFAQVEQHQRAIRDYQKQIEKLNDDLKTALEKEEAAKKSE